MRRDRGRRLAGKAWAPAALLMLLAALPVGGGARAAGVRNQDPFWFRDGYTTLAAVDTAVTTASVDTAAGAVMLPYGPFQLATEGGDGRALVATPLGIQGDVWDGSGLRPVPAGPLNAVDADGVSFIDGGRGLAVSTPADVAVYGLDAAGELHRVAALAATGRGDLAPGPAALPYSFLEATATGAQLFAVQAGALVALGGGPEGLTGNLGVSASPSGSVVATWQSGGVQIWAWDGARYRPAAAWDAPGPAASAGAVAGVAFFAGGGGYWILTQGGQLRAYAYGPWGALALPAWTLSLSARPDPPAGLSSGWGPGSVAVLYPWGWTYLDPRSGGSLGPDPQRSLGGQAFAAFAPQATLQGMAVTVDHPVTQLRVEDADCGAGAVPPACATLPSTPPGTAVSYEVSADGCAGWIAAPAFRNVAVPAGNAVCYRMTLRTDDPRTTPRVFVTNLFEIASVMVHGAVASLLCRPGAC